MRIKNAMLAGVMQQLRSNRPRLQREQKYCNRTERSRGGNYVEVWFLTSGCQWDAHGGCTMCNYGQGPNPTVDEIVNAVKEGLYAIDVEVDELVVSPSGSMLDSREVPPEARRQVFAMIKEFSTPQFVFETRAESVTDDVIREYVEIISDKKLGVEIGLESSNPWILHYCVNKGMDPGSFTRAAGILHKYSVLVYANVLLGIPFLHPTETIHDSVNSISWAFKNGADISVLFPNHVKPFTLSAWLYERGLYKPPSLWSLVEVLSRIGPERTTRTEISWYRNYYDDKSKVIDSPSTCPNCIKDVLSLLDEYRDSRSYRVVEHLSNYPCECRQGWRREVDNPPRASAVERIIEVYKILASEFYSENWWTRESVAIEKGIRRGFVPI